VAITNRLNDLALLKIEKNILNHINDVISMFDSNFVEKTVNSLFFK